MAEWIEINEKTKIIIDDTSIQVSQLKWNSDWDYNSIYLRKKDIVKILEEVNKDEIIKLIEQTIKGE